MRRLISFFGMMFSSMLGIMVSLSISASYIYFLYKAAKLDHWIWFAVGFILPPIGFIGGALAFFGLIWEAPLPSDRAGKTEINMKAETLKSRGLLSMMLSAIDRCSWNDISAADKRAITTLKLRTKDAAIQRFGASEQEVAMADGGAIGAVGAMKCDDPNLLPAIKQMLVEFRSNLGQNYEKLQ